MVNWKFWEKKEYIPMREIPEKNDKEAGYNAKNKWELILIMYVEAVFFAGMFILQYNIDVWGLVIGFIVTAAICFLMGVVVYIVYMWRKVTVTEKLGKKSGIDLIAYNIEGKKYEDNFLIEDVQEIPSKDDIQAALKAQNAEVEDPKDLAGRTKLFKVLGAFRRNKPLEEWMVITKHKFAEHLEFNDTTANFYHGAISVKKDVPSLSIKQIGHYGEHQLPLVRVDSSCVSRSDKKLFAADLNAVIKAQEAEDHWQATAKDKEIHGLKKTVASLKHINNNLLLKIESLKTRHEQIDEVGGEEKPTEEPSVLQRVKSWIERLLVFVAGVVTYWLFLKVTGVLP